METISYTRLRRQGTCFGTLHTTDAAQSMDRVVDVFAPSQQQQVRVQLSAVLGAVVCQSLMPRADGQGRIAVRGIMIVTPAISNLIREGKTHMIPNALETGQKFGMITLDKALIELVRKGFVTVEDACAKAHNPDAVRAGKAGGATPAY